MAKQYLKWYENHKAAWRAGKFDYDSFSDFNGATNFKCMEVLNEGKTMRFIWEVLVQELPITSQLMMSDELFNHIPNSAVAKLKRDFKNLEIKLISEITKENYSPQTNA